MMVILEILFYPVLAGYFVAFVAALAYLYRTRRGGGSSGPRMLAAAIVFVYGGGLANFLLLQGNHPWFAMHPSPDFTWQDLGPIRWPLAIAGSAIYVAQLAAPLSFRLPLRLKLPLLVLWGAVSLYIGWRIMWGVVAYFWFIGVPLLAILAALFIASWLHERRSARGEAQPSS